MRGDELRKRTKSFALRVVKMVETLSKGKTPDVIGRQLLRSGTSGGANYRAACRAKSSADFISKMGTGEEEADESIYGREFLIDSGHVSEHLAKDLLKEAEELLSIVVSSIKTARKAVKS